MLISLPDFIFKFYDYTVAKANWSTMKGSVEEALESKDKVDSVHLMIWDYDCFPISERSSKRSENFNIIFIFVITLFPQVTDSTTFYIWKH